MLKLLLATIFTIAELNCENLFDYRHDSLKNDYEFLPNAERQWTPQRYWRKINSLGKVILSTADGLPDIVCLTEVENDSVLHDLTRRSLLRNAGYEYLITNSPDERGIDVALLYQPQKFKLIQSDTIRIPVPDHQHPTRDILFASGLVRNSDNNIDTLNIFVVHFPSRRGDTKESRLYRNLVAQTLLQHINNTNAYIIAGDFNDYADGESLNLFYKQGFSNLANEGKVKGRYNNVKGTYKYQGEWNSLDHILIRGNIKEKVIDSYINDPDFLLSGEDEKLTPFRTYKGKFYQGGYSDHLPLLLRIDLDR